jgi:hypothetical protein
MTRRILSASSALSAFKGLVRYGGLQRGLPLGVSKSLILPQEVAAALDQVSLICPMKLLTVSKAKAQFSGIARDVVRSRKPVRKHEA